MLKTGELANDVGTVLFGEDAVKNKLINSVGGLSNSINKLYELIAERRQKQEQINANSLTASGMTSNTTCGGGQLQ